MFKVLHSSAGAGKTHMLVKHYLEHCLSGHEPEGYRQVLALTFTNKAAAEMKERVLDYLERLSNGAVNDGPMPDLADHLKKVCKVDDATLQERADAVLGHMLHHWSDVAISTIDAFTHRVVRPFARDLRLDHDLRMTTEQTYYRERAVDALIEAAGSDPRITELLTQACLQLLHEERSWDPSKPLLDLSNELLKESAIKPLEKMRSLSVGEIVPLIDRLNRDGVLFRRRVNALGKAGLDLFAQHGLGEADVAYGKGGILGYFRKLSQFTDAWDAPGPQALKPLATGKWNSAKATPDAIAALEGIAHRLKDLFEEADSIREKDLRKYLVQRAVARELLPAFALHELDTKLEALKQADGVAFFGDLTRRVAEVVKNERVPFIYERLGERYRHFLIDEFQDTSLLQWNALLPLIENALSSGGSTLLVGDAKQAIYRWRNGEVRLFVDLPNVFGRGDDPEEAEREATLIRSYCEGERLDHNRRSAKRIIAFNNALFGALAQQLPQDLRAVYDRHDQRTFHTDEGIVSIERAGPGVKGVELQQAILDHALRNFERALADGFSPGDIAILVRSKRIGRAIAAHLLEHGHAVISPDGLQLAADPAIQLLIELLRFLHAGEAVAAVRVLQWQAIVAADRAGSTTPVGLFTPGNDLPDPAALVAQWLSDHGQPRLRTTLTGLVTELARAHGLKPAEDAAVLTLLDEVHKWTTDHTQDIGGFLEHWDRSGGERSTATPEQGQAVQVMTVHKSKGLQFPVVIVPDARMSSNTNHGELFWVDPGEAVPELEVALIRESRTSRGAELPEMIEEDGLRTLDALNLLYVAFTRPEQRLYAFVPDGTDAVTKGLIEFITANEQLVRPGGSVEPPRKKRSTEAAGPLFDITADHGPPTLTIRFEAPDDWDPADPDPRRAFGTAVHETLAATRTADDLPRSLQRAVSAGDLTEEQSAALLRHLGPRINSPDLAPWFAPHLDVRAEATLITADGHSLRPDRLVFDGDRVRVLEFKTGAPSQAHEHQVRAYLDLLRQLGHREVEGAVWYLSDGRLHPVT
ncbi:MAG: UvrD-helicase domain-containing protein [Flavobacteriales bacterium]|nr:UvrD-helicase domain-containing protein [Flavobacteriales bacterium]